MRRVQPVCCDRCRTGLLPWGFPGIGADRVPCVIAVTKTFDTIALAPLTARTGWLYGIRRVRFGSTAASAKPGRHDLITQMARLVMNYKFGEW